MENKITIQGEPKITKSVRITMSTKINKMVI